MPRIRLTGLVLALVILASGCYGARTQWTRQLADGVTLTQVLQTRGKDEADCKPLWINVITADPKKPGVQVRAVLAQDMVMNDDPTKGREVVSSMVKRTGALAGVNGDYHNWEGKPSNLFIINGELVTEPWSRRPCFAIKDDGTFLMDKVDFDGKITTESGESCKIGGINRQPDGDELILYTPIFFRNTMTKPQANEAIIETSDLPANIGRKITGKVVEIRKGGSPLKPGTVVISGIAISGSFVSRKLEVGQSVTIDLKMTPRETGSWERVKYCIGGCPWVVKGGKFYMDIEEEHIEPGFYDVGHPRTAVGKTADGKVVIVTVDGRQSISGGMTCKELGDLMLSLGCVEAINLDGGGSTEMATQFGILNSPSDGAERATATALCVYAPSPMPPPSISPQMKEIKAGATAKFTVVDAKGKPLLKKSLDKVIWATNGRIGVVEPSGTFHALKSHEGAIYAQVGGQTLSMPITVLAGELSRIVATLKPGPEDKPNTGKLSVWARDANGNPVKWQKVTLTLTGGSADKTELATSDDGVAFADITWDGPATDAQQVEARCGEVSAVAKRIGK